MTLVALRFRHNERLRFASENYPVMRKGEKGQPVRIVQQALIDLGHPMPDSTAQFGSPDGVYGGETKTKVKDFQRKKSLSKDGVVGRQTLTKMDELLKLIPFKPLPNIPGPGGAKNIAVNAALTIRDVLASSILRSINFNLEHSQRQRRPDLDDPSPNHVIAHHRAFFRGENYMRVAQAVSDGEISVRSGAGSRTAAQYIPNRLIDGLPENTILVGRELSAQNPNDRSLIVHEGAHAVCDVQKLNSVNGIFSEMISYIAEAFYRDLAGLGPKGVIGDARVVYEFAHTAIKYLRKGNQPPAHMMDEMWFALESSYAGFSDSVVKYDGI